MSWSTATRLLLTQPLPILGWAAGDLLVRSTLLLLAALAVRRLLARRSAALRHVVGLATLFAVVALPLAMSWLPASAAVLPSLGELLAWLRGADPRSGAPLAVVPTGWWIVLGTIWALGVGAVAARLVRGHRRLDAVFRRARPWPPWNDVVDAARGAHGLATPIALRVSPEVDVPIVYGVLVPRLLLPASAATWDRERLELVLLHELAHVRRRDPLAQAAGVLGCALYWFHPLVWRAASALALDREQACDDLVLGVRGDANRYARQLVAIADGARARPPALAIPMARPSQLVRRLHALLDETADRTSVGARHAALAVSTALLALLAVAAGDGVAGVAEARAGGGAVAASPSDARGGHSGAAHRGERSASEGTEAGDAAGHLGDGHGGRGARPRGHASGHASGLHPERVRDGHAAEEAEAGAEPADPAVD